MKSKLWAYILSTNVIIMSMCACDGYSMWNKAEKISGIWRWIGHGLLLVNGNIHVLYNTEFLRKHFQ